MKSSEDSPIIITYREVLLHRILLSWYERVPIRFLRSKKEDFRWRASARGTTRRRLPTWLMGPPTCKRSEKFSRRECV